MTSMMMAPPNRMVNQTSGVWAAWVRLRGMVRIPAPSTVFVRKTAAWEVVILSSVRVNKISPPSNRD
ncbi:hypothetical protein D3C81_2328030 [compost metagenome]